MNVTIKKYQNLLFYYESETSSRPSGIIFLEGCYCERLVSAPACISGSPLLTNNNANANSSKTNKEEKLQVEWKLFYQNLFYVCVCVCLFATVSGRLLILFIFISFINIYTFLSQFFHAPYCSLFIMNC
jgi:hypothetical protein